MKLGKPQDDKLRGTFGSRLGTALLASVLALSSVPAPALAEAATELGLDDPVAVVDDANADDVSADEQDIDLELEDEEVVADEAIAVADDADADVEAEPAVEDAEVDEPLAADGTEELVAQDDEKATYGGAVTASLVSSTQVQISGTTGYTVGRGPSATNYDAMTNPKVKIVCDDTTYAEDAEISDGAVTIEGEIAVGTYTVTISSDNYADKSVTFSYPELSTATIGGAEYQWLDADKALSLVGDEAKAAALDGFTRVGDTSVYYKSDNPLQGTLYGMDMSTSTNYSELYNQLIEGGSAQAADYDAISSATGIVNNKHYSQLSTLVAREIAGNEGDALLQNKLTGAYATTVKVDDATAYAEAYILSAAGKDLDDDQKALLNVRLNGNATIDPATVTDRVAVDTETTSGFFTGYSYFDPTALAGSKAYGHLKLVIRPTAGENTTGGTAFSWTDYYQSVYAGTFSDGTTTVGMAPWIDLYTEAGHSAVEMSISNGTNPYNSSSQATVNRYASFYDSASGRLKAGNYTVTIYAAGYNPLSYTFHIAAAVPTANLTSVELQNVDTASLEGKTATVTAYAANEGEGNAAVEGEAYATDATITDGKVALTKALAAGDYKVVADGFTYTFSVSEEAVAEVQNADLANATVALAKTSYVYTGKQIKPAVTVTSAKGTTLVKDTDYTVAYENNTNFGTATVTVTGKGSYTGSKKVTFSITAAAQTITATNKSVVYGKTVKLAATTSGDGKLTYKSADTSVAKVSAAGVVTPVKVGSVKVTITAAKTDNYKAATKTVTVTVTKAASTIKLAAQTQAYTGEALAYSGKVTKTGSGGKVTYKYFSDAKCTKEVKAANVKNAGTYYVKATVAATANYKAATSAAAKLTITKAANTLTVKAVKATQTAKYGKQTTLAASKVFKVTKNVSKGKLTYAKASGNAKITVSSAGKVTVKKGLKKGKYTIKVKVTSKATANYKAASKTVTFTVKVV